MVLSKSIKPPNVHLMAIYPAKLVYKQMYWIQTNLRRFHPIFECLMQHSNVYTSLHNGVCW